MLKMRSSFGYFLTKHYKWRLYFRDQLKYSTCLISNLISLQLDYLTVWLFGLLYRSSNKGPWDSGVSSITILAIAIMRLRRMVFWVNRHSSFINHTNCRAAYRYTIYVYIYIYILITVFLWFDRYMVSEVSVPIKISEGIYSNTLVIFWLNSRHS